MTRKILTLGCAMAALAAGSVLAQTAPSNSDLSSQQNAEARLSVDEALNDAPPIDEAAAVSPTAKQTVAADVATTDIAAAPTPAAEPASASVTSMAYAANIANAPGGLFKAKVGEYRMSAYASPPTPIAYDQLDAYLRAPRKEQLARNWSGGDVQQASTASSADVSASVPAAPSNSTAGIPNDTAPVDPTPGGVDSDTSVNPPVTPANPATPPDTQPL